MGIAFLELNGFDFCATEEEATQAIFGLAAGELDEAAYAAWLRSNVKRRGR
jgi:death-on-curing protein